jgi:hypothetical protein
MASVVPIRTVIRWANTTPSQKVYVVSAHPSRVNNLRNTRFLTRVHPTAIDKRVLWSTLNQQEARCVAAESGEQDAWVWEMTLQQAKDVGSFLNMTLQLSVEPPRCDFDGDERYQVQEVALVRPNQWRPLPRIFRGGDGKRRLF